MTEKPDFVYSLPRGGELVDTADELALDPETETALRARLRELERPRIAAVASGSRYVVGSAS